MTTGDPGQLLYEIGLNDLESRFSPDLNLVRDPFLPHRHQPHPSLWYANCLLNAGDTARAEAIIEAALALQELRVGDPHHGNFRWHQEDATVIDLNACQFVLEALSWTPIERLSFSLKERLRSAELLALAEAERLNVHWTYTNIYLLDVRNRILLGEQLGDENVARTGTKRLIRWAEQTRGVGAPHEFNSPTYAAVQINCLASIAQRSKTPQAFATALEMEELLWRHVAKYWHTPTRQLSGPHSRAYRRDVVGAPGFLKVILYKLLGDDRLLADIPYYSGPAAEGHVIVAGIDYHCPPDTLAALQEATTREVSETAALNPLTRTSAVLTPEYSLGTMSRPYGVGDPPEPWPAHNSCIAYWKRDTDPGHGVLYTRYRLNAPLQRPTSGEGPGWLDIWDEGVFRCAQTGNRAIVAYGLMPRGQRPVESLRLDIRILGPAPDGFHIGDTQWDGAPTDIGSKPVVINDSQVYIGLVLLEPTKLGHSPTATLYQDGMESVISIFNYSGPPKVFWELRSLSGPFWKGNVRNGFALWIAARNDFVSSTDFHEALAALPLSDETDGSARRVVWGEGDDAVSLEYDLRTMWP